MKKLTKKQKMGLVLVGCIALSVYALHSWAQFGPLTVGSYISSALIHVAVPYFLAFAIINKKLTE